MLQSVPKLGGGLAQLELPRTLGHEIAGSIAELGPGVAGRSVGENVIAFASPGCGHCQECVRGNENYCVSGFVAPGVQRDGGLAEYVVVSARAVAPIGSLDVTQAAPLADAGMTAYHAVRLARDALRPGGTAVVVGVGGLGHIAVQVLHDLGSQVIAVDVDEAKLALARRCGAVGGVRAAAEIAPEGTAREVMELAGGRADAAFDFVGVDSSLLVSTSVVRSGGAVRVVGTGGGSVPFGYGRLPGREISLQMASGGTQGDLRDVIALAIAGRVTVSVEPFDFSAVDQVLAKLESGSVVGRAVVRP
jgi:propanol-preferring alcohol dehydrogenase